MNVLFHLSQDLRHDQQAAKKIQHKMDPNSNFDIFLPPHGVNDRQHGKELRNPVIKAARNDKA
jgi:hypothetical protein